LGTIGGKWTSLVHCTPTPLATIQANIGYNAPPSSAQFHFAIIGHQFCHHRAPTFLSSGTNFAIIGHQFCHHRATILPLFSINQFHQSLAFFSAIIGILQINSPAIH